LKRKNTFKKLYKPENIQVNLQKVEVLR